MSAIFGSNAARAMNERSETPPNTVNTSLTPTTQSVATPRISLAKKINATYFIRYLASTLESTSFPQLEESSGHFGHGSATTAHQWHICLALGAKKCSCFLESVSSLRVGYLVLAERGILGALLERPIGIEHARSDRAGAFESSGRIKIEQAGLDGARRIGSSSLNRSSRSSEWLERLDLLELARSKIPVSTTVDRSWLNR
ncbi:hypothetical protein DFH09DRAFT_1096855 [Mycena vulgaris]|nr:hypothetical protein DFH09DRAFT_1096855 [Mycena vulgaris]